MEKFIYNEKTEAFVNNNIACICLKLLKSITVDIDNYG